MSALWRERVSRWAENGPNEQVRAHRAAGQDGSLRESNSPRATRRSAGGLAGAEVKTPDSREVLELAGRDRQIVQAVARFKQLSSSQIRKLIFHTSSHTPLDRALHRLTNQQFLIRIERRIVGGSRGGSGQYCYALGRRGYYMRFGGGFRPDRVIRYHTLAIADCFIAIKQLEDQGVLAVSGYSTEPDCHIVLGGVQLKPDMYLDLRTARESLKLFIEQDMGTENQKQLRGKLETYFKAWSDADARNHPQHLFVRDDQGNKLMEEVLVEDKWIKVPKLMFPKVVFVAVDAEREAELNWLLTQISKEAKQLFQVVTVDTIDTLFI